MFSCRPIFPGICLLKHFVSNLCIGEFLPIPTRCKSRYIPDSSHLATSSQNLQQLHSLLFVLSSGYLLSLRLSLQMVSGWNQPMRLWAEDRDQRAWPRCSFFSPTEFWLPSIVFAPIVWPLPYCPISHVFPWTFLSTHISSANITGNVITSPCD